MLTQCSNIFRFALLILLIIIFSRIRRINAQLDIDFNEQKIRCSQQLNKALNTICKNAFNKRLRRYLDEFEFGQIQSVQAKGEVFYDHLKSKTQDQNREYGGQVDDVSSTKKFEKLKESKGDTGYKHYGGRRDENGVNSFTRQQRSLNYIVGRGVVDECCLKGCRYTDLLKYCA